jgi:hypothetical protein
MSTAGVAGRALGNPGINNTAFLFFALTAAFIFWVTVRGDLPAWLGLFGLAGAPKSGGASPATGSSAGASTSSPLSGYQGGATTPSIPNPSALGTSGGGLTTSPLTDALSGLMTVN